MDIQSIPLGAGARTRMVIPGRFFMLVQADAPIDVSFEYRSRTLGEQARSVEAGYVRFPGDWSNAAAGVFDAVILQSATAQTVRIGVSQEAADYRRTVGIVQLEGANDGETFADQTVSNVIAEVAQENSNRRGAVIVQNVEDAGGGIVRVAVGVAATPTRGVRLAPGQSVTFHTTQNINAIREGGVDVDVSVTEETRT